MQNTETTISATKGASAGDASGKANHWKPNADHIGIATKEGAQWVRSLDGFVISETDILRLIKDRDELLTALKDLAKEIPLSRFNISKDFSLLNAHASATKAIANAERGSK